MRKILIVSTVSRQFYLFEQGNIEILKSLGYEVHGAANFEDANERLDSLNIIRHPFDIQRSPFSLKNVNAYRQLKQIMKLENFDVVHCHSPMGGVLARLAAKSVGIRKVIYTAHGFHFYKGASFINWLLYYPIERFLSRYTQIIITINSEDYKRAQKFKKTTVKYVPGVGVELNNFENKVEIRNRKRIELGIGVSDFVLLSVGEVNRNKNHEVIIKSLQKVKDSQIVYLICGKGMLSDYLIKLAKKLEVSSKIRLVGFRNDVREIYHVADAFVFPSLREGLSLSLMEAMAAGLPVICSNIRGNSDLIDDQNGGFLLPAKNIQKFTDSIKNLKNDRDLCARMGAYNIEKVNKFSSLNIKEMMRQIYRESSEHYE